MSKDIKQGWQCPVCGNVYAPHVDKCVNYHAPQQAYEPYPYWPQPWWLQWPYYQPHRPYWGTVTTSESTGSSNVRITGGVSSSGTVVLDGTEIVSFTNNGGQSQ